MKIRTISNGLLYRLLRLARLPVRLKARAEGAKHVIEIWVPHPELNLDDFWAFRRTAE
jgi:hypothetical protein